MKSWSFPPVVNNNSEILILGTMPGKKSLEMQEYYAHKHNTFWKILFNLFETEFSSNYEDKINLLTEHKIALWDTLKYCEREGSADALINNEIPNDFDAFFYSYTGIRSVFFNGTAAFRFYNTYSTPKKHINYITLPSTSPANARYSFHEKLNSWLIIKEILNK